MFTVVYQRVGDCANMLYHHTVVRHVLAIPTLLNFTWSYQQHSRGNEFPLRKEAKIERGRHSVAYEHSQAVKLHNTIAQSISMPLPTILDKE